MYPLGYEPNAHGMTTADRFRLVHFAKLDLQKVYDNVVKHQRDSSMDHNELVDMINDMEAALHLLSDIMHDIKKF